MGLLKWLFGKKTKDTSGSSPGGLKQKTRQAIYSDFKAKQRAMVREKLQQDLMKVAVAPGQNEHEVAIRVLLEADESGKWAEIEKEYEPTVIGLIAAERGVTTEEVQAIIDEGGRSGADRAADPIDELIAALGSGDEAPRVEAAVRLHEHATSRSVLALTEALTDESRDVRAAAAESLRVLAVLGEATIRPEPLLEALRTNPRLQSLKACLRELGLGAEAERVIDDSLGAVPKYHVACMPFGCPHCGIEITRAPSWPAHGNSVPFYAQTDLHQSGAHSVEMTCRACGGTVYIVWDDDPR